MNARKHRKSAQAKETDRLEPKGTQSVLALCRVPDANKRLPVYRAGLNHPVNITEHGKAATSSGPRSRAGLTARRARGRSIRMTEEAKASGNALDRPTSVGSILAREVAEPS